MPECYVVALAQELQSHGVEIRLSTTCLAVAPVCNRNSHAAGSLSLDHPRSELSIRSTISTAMSRHDRRFNSVPSAVHSVLQCSGRDRQFLIPLIQQSILSDSPTNSDLKFSGKRSAIPAVFGNTTASPEHNASCTFNPYGS
jgi:hypothetical protein